MKEPYAVNYEHILRTPFPCRPSRLEKTNKNDEKINKTLSLLCLLNVYETPNRSESDSEDENQRCGRWIKPLKERKKLKNKSERQQRRKQLTPSQPPRLGELESIAVTHGAEKNHRQRHQSQLHSPG